MLSVRLAGEGDAEIVADLMTALNEATGPSSVRGRPPDVMRVTPVQAAARMAAMQATERVLLAEADGSAAGLLSLRIVPYLSQDGPYAEVAELYVLPERRRCGVARRLMSDAEAIARSRECTALHVNAARNNEAAEAFYESVGYEPREIGFEKYLAE